MQKTHDITLERAVLFLWLETQGRIFTVKFFKKNGTLRTMTARRNVKKHLRGGDLPYDPVKKLLLPVFDMSIREYRMVNLRGLQSFSIGGETFNVK